jgi:hypothetical protein
MGAISAMAGTSEESRLKLFPALMHCLDSPPECALQTIAQGIYNFSFSWEMKAPI